MRTAFLCVLAMLWATPAMAERIAIAPFSGKGGVGTRNQVMAALCGEAECVPEKKVLTGGKPDLKKAKKEKVKFIITGKVIAKGKKKSLELKVENRAGGTELKQSWPLENLLLSDHNLAAMGEALGNAIGLKPKPPPEEKKPPPEETKPPPEETKPP